eukprot:12890877-Prorocentrum_lima.AAC.1
MVLVALRGRCTCAGLESWSMQCAHQPVYQAPMYLCEHLLASSCLALSTWRRSYRTGGGVEGLMSLAADDDHVAAD